MVEHRKFTKVTRSILVLILCAAMLFFCVAPGFAVVASAGVIVPVVLAAMGAFGVGTLVHGMSASEISSWLSSELDSWAASLSDTIDNLIPISSIVTNPLGALVILPATAAKIVTFVRWLVAKHNVVAGGSPEVVFSNSDFVELPVVANLLPATIKASGFKVCKYRFPGISSGGNDIFGASNGSSVFLFVYSSSSNQRTIVGVSSVSNREAYIASDSFNTSFRGFLSSSYTSNGRTVRYGSFYTSDYVADPYVVPYYNTLQAGLDAAATFIAEGPSSLSLVPEGAIDYPTYTGDDEEEMPFVVDWGGVPGMSLDDAADEIMDRVADNDLVSTGSVALDPDNVTWPDIVTAPQVPGLDDVFPFCVPFDVYHFFQALVAAPEAPHWEVPFVVPGLVNYTFVIDLSQFNTVAQIFRTMELLCFCVGLALATRRLIRG